MSEVTVSEHLKVPLMMEKDHPTLPIKIGEREPEAFEIIGLVRRVMNETGNILLHRKKKNLGAFVADVLKSAEERDANVRTNILLHEVRSASGSPLAKAKQQ